jgi:predicted O-methyltransferase YrrM
VNHYFESIQGWFTFPNFYKNIVSYLPSGSTIVEVGCWKGKSSSYLAVEILNSGKDIKLICVDTFDGSAEHVIKNSPFYEPLLEQKDGLYNEFLKNIDPVKDIVEIVRSASLDAADKIANDSVDLVFIDAAHDYDSVYQDIKYWLPKVKEGRFLAGHDVAYAPIQKALQEHFGNGYKNMGEDVWFFKKQKV